MRRKTDFIKFLFKYSRTRNVDYVIPYNIASLRRYIFYHSRKRLLERLDSPSGVFDQSFARDDNGTDIHCAKVQRESARYIADRLGRDFEKPVDLIVHGVFGYSHRDISSCNKAKLLASARPFRVACTCNANRPRINGTLLLPHTRI